MASKKVGVVAGIMGQKRRDKGFDESTLLQVCFDIFHRYLFPVFCFLFSLPSSSCFACEKKWHYSSGQHGVSSSPFSYPIAATVSWPRKRPRPCWNRTWRTRRRFHRCFPGRKSRPAIGTFTRTFSRWPTWPNGISWRKSWPAWTCYGGAPWCPYRNFIPAA